MFEEQRNKGMEVRLRPRGGGRFAAATFLGVWLCGWAVGEVVVAGVLIALAIGWITGEPVSPKLAPDSAGATAVGVGFMLVWLTGWTFGGIAAIRQFLRSVWAEDRIVAAGYGLIVERRLGPFRTTREIPRDELLGIRFVPGLGQLIADTRRGSVELSNLGNREDRERAVTVLNDYLGLTVDPDADAPAVLPKGWEEIITPRGESVLVENAAARRKLAHVVLAAATVAAVGGMMMMLVSVQRRDVAPTAALVCAAAVGLGFLANRLYFTRTEWLVGNGTLTLRKRNGARVREVFHAFALELTAGTDGDGDDWFTLEALPPAPEGERRKIAHAVHAPSAVQRLGRWIAQRTGLSFSDRSGKEDRGVDLEALKEQIAGHGRFGRWIVRWIERAEARRKAS